MNPGKLARTFLLTAGLLLPAAAAADGYALRRVQPGDTLGTIAASYGLAVDVLMNYNDLEAEMIHPGDLLKVPYIRATGGAAQPAPRPPAGFREHVLGPGETLSGVAGEYGVSIEALVGANPDISSLDRLPEGVELLIPREEGLVVTLGEAADLEALLAEHGVQPLEVARANDIRSLADLQAGMLLFLPGVTPDRALERLARVREEELRYIWPLHGRLTSYFGRRNLGMGTSSFHRGIDIAAPHGTPVVAARAGTVIHSGWSASGYGNLIRIRHQGGDETWYGHFSTLLVSEGEYVEQGENIGLVGSTGLSTGPHLHLELHETGTAVDPIGYLN
ncbi:MAG TPA: M23 family metallopeptidase [Deinococcales bacterium]|nr:M23 family metallopeptidase [Deinococcales bacterium]